MLNTEKGLEILPMIASIYEKLNIKDYVKKQTELALAKNKKAALKKELTKEEVAQSIGIDVILDTLFSLVFKNAKLITEEIVEIVAIVQDSDIEIVKNQSIIKTFKVIKELLKDEELKTLFS